MLHEMMALIGVCVCVRRLLTQSLARIRILGYRVLVQWDKFVFYNNAALSQIANNINIVYRIFDTFKYRSSFNNNALGAVCIFHSPHLHDVTPQLHPTPYRDYIFLESNQLFSVVHYYACCGRILIITQLKGCQGRV